MPRMDGLAATRAIRAQGGRSAGTPIIALTADVLPEHVERCRMAGMVDHVAKPVRPEALHAALARWINDQTPADERKIA
jgi:CheY-like chemotaxis protein